MGTQVSITRNGTTSTISISRESNIAVLTRRSKTESSVSIISQNDTNKQLEFLILLKKVVQSLAQDDGCHNNIICDYCKAEDFRDHRYKCLICDDYDLCGDCFEQRNYNKNHQIKHPVILFKQPVASQQCQVMLDLFQKQTTINRDDLNFITHETVTCDGCGLKPLVGVRFKCDQCIDYDLCYNCYKSTKTTKKHKADHSLVAIMTPNQNKFKIQDVNLAGSQRLGNGFFAQVYKAQWQNKTIALKKMVMTNDGRSNKELVTFNNEVLAYSEINSYKILQYHGCDIRKVNDGEIEFYIATEFMPNGTLEHALKNNDQYTHRRKFQWLLTIVKGLRRLHDKQFIHKDIKPDNLLIDDCWNLKIGDMGVALHKNDQYTFDQGFAPRKYSAPEVLNGQPYSYKADVFSFGLIMNYIFTETEHIGEGQHISFKKDSPFFASIVTIIFT